MYPAVNTQTKTPWLIIVISYRVVCTTASALPPRDWRAVGCYTNVTTNMWVTRCAVTSQRPCREVAEVCRLHHHLTGPGPCVRSAVDRKGRRSAWLHGGGRADAAGSDPGRHSRTRTRPSHGANARSHSPCTAVCHVCSGTKSRQQCTHLSHKTLCDRNVNHPPSLQ